MNPKTEALFDPAALKTVPVRPLRIKILSGADQGSTFTVRQRKIVMGSDPDVAIPLTDGTVSRRHVALEHTAKGLLVRDLGSTNGTYFDTLRIQMAYMQIPGTIRLGNTEVTVEGTDEPEVELDVYTGGKLAGMVGQSPAMQEILGLMARVGPTDATVLITGESGTGKELVARGVHELSKRKDKPFIVFDCSAVAPELIESELFGHVKGAFTGASGTRTGAFKEAHQGTLFLDEIGELSSDLQPKLLRVLENKEVKAVGSEKREKVDVRIVAATNRSLRSMVEERTFREDLFFRLAHIELNLPPLRDRADDIPLLINTFLAQTEGGSDLEISYDTMQRLMQHPWPGNVRELKNYVDRAAILAIDGRIETRFLGPGRQSNQAQGSDGLTGQQGGSAKVVSQGGPDLTVRYDIPFKDAKSRLIESFEKAYWTQMLERHRWNVSAAAREAGIHRKSLEYVVRKLGLKDPP